MYSLAVLGVVIKDKRVLLALRNDLDNPEFHRKWELPGGAVDNGETLTQAVLREVTEETGLVVKLKSKFPAVCIGLMSRYAREKGAEGHILIGYVCEIIGGALGKNVSSETLELRWFGLSEIDSSKSLPGTRELVGEFLTS